MNYCLIRTHKEGTPCSAFNCTNRSHWYDCDSPGVVKYEGQWWCQSHYDEWTWECDDQPREQRLEK